MRFKDVRVEIPDKETDFFFFNREIQKNDLDEYKNHLVDYLIKFNIEFEVFSEVFNYGLGPGEIGTRYSISVNKEINIFIISTVERDVSIPIVIFPIGNWLGARDFFKTIAIEGWFPKCWKPPESTPFEKIKAFWRR